MKTIPIGLAPEYTAGTSRLGYLLRIQRTDGVVKAFTSALRDVTISGVVYSGKSGLDVSSLVSRAGLAVDNISLTCLNNGELFLVNDIVAGRWKLAKWLLSEYNVANPTAGINPLLGGTVGGIDFDDVNITADLRAVQQYLQNATISYVTSKTCRAELGNSRCKVNLAPFTFAATVTTAGQQIITATALTQDDDYFGNGNIRWLTGDNAGIRVQVKEFAAGVLTLNTPMFFAVQAGDTFEAVAGCRKRHDRTLQNLSGISDCLDKFDNVLNNQSDPHLPGEDALIKSL